MNEADQITYLANVIAIASADGSISPKEAAALEAIRVCIGSKKGTFNAAQKAAQSGNFQPIKAGRFADQVANIADMLYVCFVDGELGAAEKPIITTFCKRVGITQDQLNGMVKEAISRCDQTSLKIPCASCKAELQADAKFCPSCGTAQRAVDAQATEFGIPGSGYAIEFCESTSASFPEALRIAQSSPALASITRGKKKWYLASWGDQSFDQVCLLANALGALRNRKVYHNGKEQSWDELFGFIWCAEERTKAYRPVEYCFGKDDGVFNPWGCKHARMEWADWARWFSYGQFVNVGRTAYVWRFDKARIRHEILANLHRYRFCPHMRLPLVDAVLALLPNEVDPQRDGNWTYSRSYDEAPGVLKIVESKKSDGYAYTDEYFADGVRPKGIGVIKAILSQAFTHLQVKDVSVTQLLS